MKNICALALVLALVLAMAAGCADNSKQPDDQTQQPNNTQQGENQPGQPDNSQSEGPRDWSVKEKTYISMVSTPMGQSSYTTAAALCDLATSTVDNLEMISEESGGYGTNVSLLINGDAEFGMTDALALQQGYNGTDDYTGYPAGQVVGLCFLPEDAGGRWH